ncbi:MAG: response regulator [Sporolactobacillus sp.]
MRALVVDDEELACRQLRRMLQETGAFRDVMTYQDAAKALETAKREPFDAAFLDIEMPEINGIDLAEELQTIVPALHIIFTTAYNEYAVKAFEVNAVDYLLKPIMRKRLEKAVDRLLKYWAERQSADHPNSGRFGIECFGSLKFYQFINGHKDYCSVKWRTNKARAVYAYLLSHHDRAVSKDVLIEQFWPDFALDKAQTQLYTTIYQIRKMMERLPFNHHIVKSDLGYVLSIVQTSIDCEKWEADLRRLPDLNDDTYAAHINLLNAYKSHYLAAYDYPWAELERIRLAQLWLVHAYAIIDYLIAASRYMDAIDVCHHIQQIEPDDDHLLHYLSRLYNYTGNLQGALRLYNREPTAD